MCVTTFKLSGGTSFSFLFYLIVGIYGLLPVPRPRSLKTSQRNPLSASRATQLVSGIRFQLYWLVGELDARGCIARASREEVASRILLVIHPKTVGNTPKTSRKHSENIPNTSRTHTENIPNTYRTHPENISKTSRKHFENAHQKTADLLMATYGAYKSLISTLIIYAKFTYSMTNKI